MFEPPQPSLAGFDFPIGVPKAFGEQTTFPGFIQALQAFGAGQWEHFYSVAETPDQISLCRPFYPKRSTSAARQTHLVEALRVGSMDDLRRLCERRTAERQAACSLFWTLGGNQVGKAAISGWREIVRPALQRGARLWPFQGSLDTLRASNGLVLAETYPAEAYAHVGARFSPGRSKRRQEDRRQAIRPLAEWAARYSASFTPNLSDMLADGFGPKSDGEDPFDAVLGLLGMIEVADGRRSEGPIDQPWIGLWEGWILGQAL